MSLVEDQQDEGSTSHAEDQQDGGNIQSQQSQAVAAHLQGLHRRKIAQLEEKLEALESGRAVKERYHCYRMH